LFENNFASSGGAIYADQSTLNGIVELTINSCVFINNSAVQGGAIYAGRKTTITNSTFALNSAVNGGTIYVNEPTASTSIYLVIIGCIFEGESHSETGGTIHAYEPIPTTARTTDCCTSNGIYCGSGEMFISDSVFRNFHVVL